MVPGGFCLNRRIHAAGSGDGTTIFWLEFMLAISIPPKEVLAPTHLLSVVGSKPTPDQKKVRPAVRLEQTKIENFIFSEKKNFGPAVSVVGLMPRRLRYLIPNPLSYSLL